MDIVLYFFTFLSLITFVMLIVHISDHNYEKKLIKKTVCPHGYEDWDDCPVCGH
jgi:hypothetical protein